MNDIPLGLLLGVLVVLLLISAFFSASETAIMALNRYRLQYLAKQKHNGAIKAQVLLKHPERLLGLTLLGKSFVNIAAASLSTVIALQIWNIAALALVLGVLTLIILIVTEAAPKTLATHKPEAIAFLAAHIYAPLLKVCHPVLWLVNTIVNSLLRLAGIKQRSIQENILLKEDLVLSMGGALMPPRYHQTMLSIMDLESATVEDIMTPRNDIIGIDIDSSLTDIMQKIQSCPYSRLPVFKKNIDRVIGFLDLHTLLTLINQVNFDKQAIIDSLSKPVFIPESTSLHKQMQTFKADRSRIGLVVDEYGDVKGLVTVDDLLHEIIGELMIDDSHIKQHRDGGITVDGSVTIREFNRITQSSLPTEGPKTINGLIIEYMETIPASGTSVNLHGYHLEIIECDNNTIKQVRFHPRAS